MNRARHILGLGLGVLLAVTASCSSDAAARESDAPKEDSPKVVLAKSGDPAGLERHHKWSEKLGQGAQPKGDIAFRNLAALGYTTVLSVDGAVPAVDLAEKHGLTYVHIPIGYDGVPEDAAARVIAAVERSNGPVYVHCHHGRHRGPAAAMMAHIVLDGATNKAAVDALKFSGTSPKYEGLYRDVAKFRGVSEKARKAVPEKLPRTVLPKGVQANMVGVDKRWTFLKYSRSNDWKGVPDSPDVSTPHEARMLWELLRELRREPAAKKAGKDFLRLAEEGEKHAIDLEKALRAKDWKAAEKHFRLVKNNCAACHGDFRD